jgi:hypothetical protein
MTESKIVAIETNYKKTLNMSYCLIIVTNNNINKPKNYSF